MKSRHNFLLLLFCVLLMRPIFSATDNTDDKISVTIAKTAEKSIENKLLGGATMAATGIGGMQLAQGIAEKGADEGASKEMQEYLKTVSCGVSGGSRDLKYGASGKMPSITRQFSDMRFEYVELSRKMKAAKEGLGLPAGIESELLVDTSMLYDSAGTNQNGISKNFDTASQRASSDSGGQRASIGGLVAGAGVIGGVVGNTVINNGDSPLGKGLKEVLGSFGGDSSKK